MMCFAQIQICKSGTSTARSGHFCIGLLRSRRIALAPSVAHSGTLARAVYPRWWRFWMEPARSSRKENEILQLLTASAFWTATGFFMRSPRLKACDVGVFVTSCISLITSFATCERAELTRSFGQIGKRKTLWVDVPRSPEKCTRAPPALHGP